VGLLNALHAYRSQCVKPLDLAAEAIEIEQEVLQEAVGCQDQAFAALGGLRVLEFRAPKEIIAHAAPLASGRMEELQQHLLVLHTGIRRRAAEAAAGQIRNVDRNLGRLGRMREMVDEGYRILTGSGSLAAFGELLHEAWLLKSELDPCVATPPVRAIYEEGFRAGALGGKLLGAGSGGCMLFFTPPEKRAAVRAALPHLEEIQVKINAPGSHIVYA
jgi:D-glycero-alpha-D-manno-heptose-7-phosphate kinase